MKRTTPRVKRGVNRPLDSKKEIEVLNEHGGIVKYHDGVPDLVYRMIRLGMTIAEVANNIQVNISTLQTWMNRYPEVRKAYDEGRWESLLVIEESLYRKAKGYEYEETKEYSGTDSLGRPWSRTVTTTKRVEPDTTALIYYTKNRYPERWRDAWHVTGGGTNMTQVNINNTLNLDSLSDKEREMVASVAMSQIESMNGFTAE